MDNSSVQSESENKKVSSYDQEKKGFDKFITELKDSIFQVLYLILKDDDSTFFSLIINVGLDYMQMMAFSFSDKINAVWKSEEFLTFVFNFFGFFQLSTYFGSAFTWTTYIIYFYLVITAIVLMVINIIYVSYAFSKKRISTIWPVIILRSVTSLFVTVFYLPITETLLSMIECQTDEQGKYTQTNFPDVECFKGTHFIHASVSILMNIIFNIIGIVVALTFFETRMKTEDITARQHSRGDVLFVLIKIVLQLSFTFFPASAQWPLVLVFLGGAIVLWYIYNIQDPYYNKDASRLMKILTTYYLWTASMMTLSKATQETSYSGGLIAWIIGLPFIGIIMLTTQRSKTQNLTQGIARVKTTQELMDHVRFLLQLIDNQKTDPNAYFYLTGYVEKHKETCQEDDCPLKVQHHRRKGDEVLSMEEIERRLILVIDRMYSRGVKKFKSSSKIRIAYAIFLLERMNSPKRAEAELNLASELVPGFEDQFIIYRFKRLLKDAGDDSGPSDKSGEQVDLIGLIAVSSYSNLLEDYMKQSADLHKEFWLELKEDKPDLERLNYLGSKVNNAMNYAKEYWQKLLKIKADIPDLLKLYGRFLIYIQNDFVEGQSLIQKANKLLTKRVYRLVTKKDEFDIDSGNEPFPYAIIVGSGRDLGRIKKTNLLFSILVGVSKDEIIGTKINSFMPDLFAIYHDSFVNNYFAPKEDGFVSPFLEMDNNVYIKNKGGYIVPVILHIKLYETFETSGQISFLGYFKTETSKSNSIYMLCTRDGTITDISATATTILEMSVNQVGRSKKNKIDKFFPGILSDLTYREAPGAEVSYKKDENIVYFMAQVIPIELRDANNKEFYQIYQNLNDGKRDVNQNDRVYGYTVKLDLIEKDKVTPKLYGASGEVLKATGDSLKIGRKKKNNGEIVRADSTKSLEQQDLSKTNINNNNDLIYGFETEQVELEINDLFQNDGVKFEIDAYLNDKPEIAREKIDYAGEIKVMALRRGKIVDPYFKWEEEKKGNNDEDEDENSIFLKKDEELENLVGKARKDRISALERMVKEAVEATKNNVSVFSLKLLTLFWFMTLFGISILQFYFLSQLFHSYEEKIDIINTYSNRITDINKINSYIIDFLTLNKDSAISSAYPETNLDERRQKLRESVTSIVTLTSALENEVNYDILKDISTENLDLVIEFPTSTDIISLNEKDALLTISGRAFNLSSMNINQINLMNHEVTNVIYNYVDVILPYHYKIATKLQEIFKRELEDYEYQFMALFIIAFIIALFCAIWGISLLIKVEEEKENILFLFLTIPLYSVEGIAKRRDKFIEYYETYAKDDKNQSDSSSDSDLSTSEKKKGKKKDDVQGVFDQSLKSGLVVSSDPDKKEEEEEALKNRNKMIKRYRANRTNQIKNSIYKMIWFIILSLIYSCAVYITLFQKKNEVRKFANQYFTNNIIPSVMLSTINENRLMHIDNTIQINGISILDATYNSLSIFGQIGEDLTEFFNFIINRNDGFESEARTLYFGDACQRLAKDLIQDCEQSLNNALMLGFFNSKEQIFKSLKRHYDELQVTPVPVTSTYVDLFIINDQFQKYTESLIVEFNSYEAGYLKTRLSDSINLQQVVMVIFLLLITIIIVFFWLPSLSRTNSEVWRTTRMINMIPLDIVNNIPKIKRYLKFLIRRNFK